MNENDVTLVVLKKLCHPFKVEKVPLLKDTVYRVKTKAKLVKGITLRLEESGILLIANTHTEINLGSPDAKQQLHKWIRQYRRLILATDKEMNECAKAQRRRGSQSSHGLV